MPPYDLTADPPHPDHGPTVVNDHPCTGCGYNLRGIPVAGNCPECGRAATLSLRGEAVRFASREYLNALDSGLVLILTSILNLRRALPRPGDERRLADRLPPRRPPPNSGMLLPTALEPFMSTHARRALTAFTFAALAAAGLILPACAGHPAKANAEGTDSSRPVPDTAPKRPADLSPPPPPLPGHT